MQFITTGGVGEEEGEQTRGFNKEETRELIYIDVEPGREIGQNLDLEREIGQNLELEKGFDDSVDLEGGLKHQKARALQQAEETAVTGGAYLIPWITPGSPPPGIIVNIVYYFSGQMPPVGLTNHLKELKQKVLDHYRHHHSAIPPSA